MRYPVIIIAVAILTACGGAASADPGGAAPTDPVTPKVTVASVTVTPATGSLLPRQTIQLSAAPKDASGGAVSGKSVSWTVSPSALATVEANGLLTAVARGTATITATVDGVSGAATITINDGGLVAASGGSVVAASGNVRLSFPSGALSASTAITVSSAVNPPSPAILVPGASFDFGPTGTQFSQPVSMNIAYDPLRLPAGTNESLVGLYRLNGTAWELLPDSHVDVATHTISATTTHFSVYTACAFPCVGPDSPDIRLSVDRNTINRLRPGGTVQVPFQVSRNNFTGSITFSLSEAPTGLTMSASLGGFVNDFATGTLTFTAAASTAPGSYRVKVYGRGLGILEQFADPQLQVTTIGLAFNPGGVSLAQGGQATSSVTLARDGVSGSVTLSASGMPAGVTATFNPNATSGTTSVVTLAASASAVPGNYTATMSALAPDGTTGSATFPVAVVAAESFTLAGTPAFANVSAPGTGSTGIRATRGPASTGTISYAVTGMPVGMTASITATSVADSVKLTVSATAAVASGNYTLIVSGTSGTTVQTATIVVTVSLPGVTTVHLDFSSCAAAGRTTWLAVQDGTGAFATITGVSGIYTFPVASGKATVVVVTADGSGRHITTVYSASTAEVDLLPTCSDSYLYESLLYPVAVSDANKRVTISATGLGANEMGQLTLGQLPSIGFEIGSPPHTLTTVPPGPVDLIGWRYHKSTPDANLRGAIVRRVNPPSGGTMTPLDFNGANSFAPASASYALSGAGGEATDKIIGYSTGANCTNYGFLGLDAPSRPGIMNGYPASAQEPNDLHQLTISTANRIAINFFHTMSAQTISLGSLISSPPGVTTLTGPYRRLQVSATVPADYPFMTYSYTDATNVVVLAGTAAYFGNQNMTLSMPNLSGLAGVQTSWFPASGSQGTFRYEVGTALVAPCKDGGTFRAASLFGSNQ